MATLWSEDEPGRVLTEVVAHKKKLWLLCRGNELLELTHTEAECLAKLIQEEVNGARKIERERVGAESVIRMHEAEIERLRLDKNHWRIRCEWHEEKIKRLSEALKPFADAVYNDNGDMTVTPCNTDAYVKAYFLMRRRALKGK
jgi:hypothetical protein